METTVEVEAPKPKPEPEPEPEEEEPRKAAAEPKAEAGGGGGPKLPTVVSLPEPVAPEWDDVITAMNRQHAIIENVGGKAVIASWEPSSHDPGRLMVVFQNKDSFLLRYSNRFISFQVHNPRGNGIARCH